MNFSEYQKKSRKTAKYPNAGKNYIYPTLGIASEAGEVANIIKKIMRDKEGVINNETKEILSKELGDVLWYIAQIATELELSLNDIAKGNIKKLYSRMKRGKLSGSGDNR